MARDHSSAAVELSPLRKAHQETGLHAGVLGPFETLAQSVLAMAPSTSPSLTIPIVFALAGNATWLVYLLATCATLIIGFCVSRFARLSASPGSLYTYTNDTLPRAFGAAAGFGLLLAYLDTHVSDQEAGDDFLDVPVGLNDHNRDASGLAELANESFSDLNGNTLSSGQIDHLALVLFNAPALPGEPGKWLIPNDGGILPAAAHIDNAFLPGTGFFKADLALPISITTPPRRTPFRFSTTTSTTPPLRPTPTPVFRASLSTSGNLDGSLCS